MKKLFYLFFFLSQLSFSQNNAFPVIDGESCTYIIHYGFLSGGNAEYELHKKEGEIRVIAKGGSNFIIDVFFKIRDRYESIISSSTLLPKYFKRDIIEGGDEIHQEYFFYHNKMIVETGDGDYYCTKTSQDMLSAFMYGRSLSSKELKRRKPFYIDMFLDEENYRMEVKYLGTEVINSKIGRIRCIKLQPKVQVGRVFSNEDDLTIWVSDDKNHILIKVEMGILVGSIDIDILKAENIKFPLSITD